MARKLTARFLHPVITVLFLTLGAKATAAAGSQCSSPPSSATYAAPSMASGYKAQLIAGNLAYPRGLKFDPEGHLLVVEQNTGILSLTLKEDDGCVSVSQNKTVVSNQHLSHGIEISPDGKTLYASTPETLWAWDYDTKKSETTSKGRKLITNMATDDHTTRTLLLSQMTKRTTMIVSRGSTSNIDPLAANISTGHSQVKAFELDGVTSPLDFDNDGVLLGWGMRNDVGVAEEPNTGGIYTVENSVDQMSRLGQDIHQNNPGEELNFLGFLNDTGGNPMKKNYGYPECYAAWDVNSIPDNKGLKVGDQFAIGSYYSKQMDQTCKNDRIAPRLTFQAHMAPLDIKFNTDASAAWVTFHGSWDREPPVGYKLSVIKFANGEPTEPSDSSTAAIDVMWNPNDKVCPNKCFRPVALAWDSSGRLYMTSDQTGEIYVIHVPKKEISGTPTNKHVGSTPKKGGASQTKSGGGAVKTKNKDSLAGRNWGEGSGAHALGIALVAICTFL